MPLLFIVSLWALPLKGSNWQPHATHIHITLYWVLHVYCISFCISISISTLLSEHAFGKPGNSCSGSEQFPDVSVVEEDTAFPSQPVDDEPHETIEATLASLLRAVKSLTTGLKEVQADNQ